MCSDNGSIGQVYVGVSRCVGKDTLQVIGWNQNKICVDTEATKWLEMDFKECIEEMRALLLRDFS
jgi:choline kinase